MDTSAVALNCESRAALVADILLGLWVIISPFVLSIPAHNPIKVSNIVAGIAAIVVTLAGGVKRDVLAAIVPVAGWIFVSGFFFHPGLAFDWSNVLSAFSLMAAAAIGDNLR
ncbi:MAG TPA: SPW repeat protein [Verrucomicrobiae bacterium]|nr:SPW repeat protein [Verrucomicrobiae bacterium]